MILCLARYLNFETFSLKMTTVAKRQESNLIILTVHYMFLFMELCIVLAIQYIQCSATICQIEQYTLSIGFPLMPLNIISKREQVKRNERETLKINAIVTLKCPFSSLTGFLYSMQTMR